MTATEEITGLILAGGRARRMAGEDKGLIELHGRPMIWWVLDRFLPQVSCVLISANRNQDQYAAFGSSVVVDAAADFSGPLAGLAAGLTRTQTEWLASVPCDSPLVPRDLVKRLYGQVVRDGVQAAVAHDGERLQPVFSLVHRNLLSDLTRYLAKGERKIDRWFERHAWRPVDFSDCPEMFLNVNTPEDLETAATWPQLRSKDNPG